MTNRAGLAGHSAALNIDQYVELISVLSQHERLADDGLQGLKSEIIVDISLIDRDLTGSRYKVNTGN